MAKVNYCKSTGVLNYLRGALLFSSVVFVVIFLLSFIVLYIFYNKFEVAYLSLINSCVAVFVSVFLLYFFDIFFRLKVYFKFKRIDFNLNQCVEFEVFGNDLNIFFERALLNINRLKRFSLISKNKKFHTMLFRSNRPLGAKGEIVSVKVVSLDNFEKMLSIKIESKPQNKLAVVDSGRNLENVCILGEVIKERSRADRQSTEREV